MDKIKSLLSKSGCKTELVDKICESLEAYKASIKESFEKDYAAKVAQAKKVCIEETDSHKRELARRLQIFCETKSAAVEAQLAKKSALNETASETKLRKIKSLLEGVEQIGSGNGEITAALNKAKQQLKIALEEKQKAVEKANKQTAIATKVLKQHRELVTEHSKLKAKSATVTEGRRQAQPIQQPRKPGQAQTTRPTILENQTRRTKKQQSNPQPTTGGFEISDIAANMDEDI